jgi:tRNA-(ms[2]io[6]A)-hydroxylase
MRAMLRLAFRTERAWAERALADLPELLLDHAHCEKRAAGMAMGLISRYADRSALLRPLSEVAREELEHFELLIGLLERRGVPYRPQEPSPYAKRLLGLARSFEPARLLDTLLCCATIEARSCERFKLLAEVSEDAELAAFYRELLACEARHHHLYVELAATVAPHAEVRERLDALLVQEANLIAEATPGVRLHG